MAAHAIGADQHQSVNRVARRLLDPQQRIRRTVLPQLGGEGANAGERRLEVMGDPAQEVGLDGRHVGLLAALVAALVWGRSAQRFQRVWQRIEGELGEQADATVLARSAYRSTDPATAPGRASCAPKEERIW